MKTIKEAPKYSFNDDRQVVNTKTGKPVTVKDGKVRLALEDGSRKTFEVKALEKSNLTPSRKKDPNRTPLNKEKIIKAYDKNPEKFSIAKYAKKHDISYGRVWSVIKNHQKAQDDATKN